MIPLEVYKVQVALFGGPSVLIYNEDRTQQWEETKPNNVKSNKRIYWYEYLQMLLLWIL